MLRASQRLVFRDSDGTMWADVACGAIQSHDVDFVTKRPSPDRYRKHQENIQDDAKLPIYQRQQSPWEPIDRIVAGPSAPAAPPTTPPDLTPTLQPPVQPEHPDVTTLIVEIRRLEALIEQHVQYASKLERITASLARLPMAKP